MSFGDYDFSLLANQSVQMAVKGAFLRVRQATGKVRVSIDGGQGVTLQAGQGFKLPAGKAFRDVTVRDVSGQANAGVIFIGDAGFDDQTLFGAVSVTGGQISTTHEIQTIAKTGAVFFSDSPVESANNGQTIRQIHVNPAGSGKTAYFKKSVYIPAIPNQFNTNGNSFVYLQKLFGVTAYPESFARPGHGSVNANSVVKCISDAVVSTGGFTFTSNAGIASPLPEGESSLEGVILEPGQALVMTFDNQDGALRLLRCGFTWYEK